MILREEHVKKLGLKEGKACGEECKEIQYSESINSWDSGEK